MTDKSVKALDVDVEEVLAGLPKDQAEKIRKAIKSDGRSRRKSETEIMEQYPHVIEGSLGLDAVANKQFVEITCTMRDCANERRVFTSDLFQVKVCEEHKKAQRAAKKDERKALLNIVKAKLAEKRAEKAEEVEA
jgi:hypothetical protein